MILHRALQSVDRFLTRAMKRLSLPIALAYLVLTFIAATGAEYITVAGNAAMTLCFFAGHLAFLDLDSPLPRIRGIDLAYGPDFTVLAEIVGHRRPDGTIVITDFRNVRKFVAP